jgi:hypothetical protein
LRGIATNINSKNDTASVSDVMRRRGRIKGICTHGAIPAQPEPYEIGIDVANPWPGDDFATTGSDAPLSGTATARPHTRRGDSHAAPGASIPAERRTENRQPHASSSLRTLPCTSVSRNGRPWNL